MLSNSRVELVRTFDPGFHAVPVLAPLLFSAFIAMVYLRVRRLLPFVIAHWLMNDGDVRVEVLLPIFG